MLGRLLVAAIIVVGGAVAFTLANDSWYAVGVVVLAWSGAIAIVIDATARHREVLPEPSPELPKARVVRR